MSPAEPATVSVRFSALLLAGGRSTRMGRDKALLPHPVSGLPLLAHQAALLRSLPGFAELLLSAPAERGYELVGPLADARLVPDAAPDCGPLAGLAAGLSAASHPRLLVLAVDLPFITSAWLDVLLAKASDRTGVVPLHMDSALGFEPLCAVYPRHTASLDAIRSALKASRLSLQRLLASAIGEGWMSHLTIPPPADGLFANWNAPSDLSAPPLSGS